MRPIYTCGGDGRFVTADGKSMAQAFLMTTSEPWVGDRRALCVVLADTLGLALETARADGCHVDGIVGTLSEQTVEHLAIRAGQATPL
jgi:hypothetical protein